METTEVNGVAVEIDMLVGGENVVAEASRSHLRPARVTQTSNAGLLHAQKIVKSPLLYLIFVRRTASLLIDDVLF